MLICIECILSDGHKNHEMGSIRNVPLFLILVLRQKQIKMVKKSIKNIQFPLKDPIESLLKLKDARRIQGKTIKNNSGAKTLGR